MRIESDPSHCGFTAIELLAATALAALLMTGLLSVIASIGRSRTAFEREANANVWHDGIIELLRRDLAAATAAENKDGAFTIIGNGAVDRSTGLNSHRNATVQYEVAILGNRPWLVRKQWADEAGGAAWVEPLCVDVLRLSVDPVLPTQPQMNAASDTAAAEVATTYRVRVDSALTTNPSLDRVLVVR